MKAMRWLWVPVFLSVFAASASAQQFGAINFRGEYIHGPYAGKTLQGQCAVDLRDDPDLQTTRCVLEVSEAVGQRTRTIFRMVDRRARIQVVGGSVLRIVMGVSTMPNDDDANFKNGFFDLSVLFPDGVILHDGATVVLGGIKQLVAVSLGGVNTDNPDCLIFDILGGDAYDGV